MRAIIYFKMGIDIHCCLNIKCESSPQLDLDNRLNLLSNKENMIYIYFSSLFFGNISYVRYMRDVLVSLNNFDLHFFWYIWIKNASSYPIFSICSCRDLRFCKIAKSFNTHRLYIQVLLVITV